MGPGIAGWRAARTFSSNVGEIARPGCGSGRSRSHDAGIHLSPHPGPPIGPDPRRGDSLDLGPDRPRGVLRGPADRSGRGRRSLPASAARRNLVSSFPWLQGGRSWCRTRPSKRPRPLPFDVPFRIGACCLTLRQSRAADPDWGMYQAPSAPERAKHEPGRHDRPSSSPVEEDLAQRAAAAARALPKRPASPDPGSPGAANPWEARWKAAGARLRPTCGRAAEGRQPPGRRYARAPRRRSPARPLPTGDRYPTAPLKAARASHVPARDAAGLRAAAGIRSAAFSAVDSQPVSARLESLAASGPAGFSTANRLCGTTRRIPRA